MSKWFLTKDALVFEVDFLSWQLFPLFSIYFWFLKFNSTMFICIWCVLCWHLLCFPPFYVPMPTGYLGGDWHATRLRNSLCALCHILLGVRELQSIPKQEEWQNQPTQGDKTAVMEMENFWRPVKEEDKEFMAHGWKKAEVWLGIELLRNILS